MSIQQIGSPNDPEATDATRAWSSTSLLKGIWAKTNSIAAAAAASLGRKPAASSAPVVLSDEDYARLLALGVSSVAGSTLAVAADAKATGTSVPTVPHVFNGVTTDMQRGNYEEVVFPLATRTASVGSQYLLNVNGRGLTLTVNVTAVSGAASLVVRLYGVVSNTELELRIILESAAITAVGTYHLRVYPGLTAAANLVANDILPHRWAVSGIHDNTDSIAYYIIANTHV